MGQFVVEGSVPEFKGTEFALPADNGKELRRFWRAERIVTTLDASGGRPFIKVRGALALRCRPGSKIAVTIEAFDRADGRRMRLVSVVGLRPGSR